MKKYRNNINGFMYWNDNGAIMVSDVAGTTAVSSSANVADFEEMIAAGTLTEIPAKFEGVFVDDTYNDTAEVSVPHREFDSGFLVCLSTGDMMFTPQQARELAKALNAAADVAEVLNAD